MCQKQHIYGVILKIAGGALLFCFEKFMTPSLHVYVFLAVKGSEGALSIFIHKQDTGLHGR